MSSWFGEIGGKLAHWTGELLYGQKSTALSMAKLLLLASPADTTLIKPPSPNETDHTEQKTVQTKAIDSPPDIQALLKERGLKLDPALFQSDIAGSIPAKKGRSNQIG